LRFSAKGLQCCGGVKEKATGPQGPDALCYRDCAHLGRQTECEPVPQPL